MTKIYLTQNNIIIMQVHYYVEQHSKNPTASGQFTKTLVKAGQKWQFEIFVYWMETVQISRELNLSLRYDVHFSRYLDGLHSKFKYFELSFFTKYRKYYRSRCLCSFTSFDLYLWAKKETITSSGLFWILRRNGYYSRIELNINLIARNTS